MQHFTTFLRLSLLTGLLVLTTSTIGAANSKTNVVQVTNTVTVSTNVDYVVSSATPFGSSGVVNITNTDHAVLILSAVKPSAAINLLAGHVKINGQQAVDGNNCQVKMYNQGTIIMPYASDFRPLTVYSERNFGGESVSDFGTEDTNGFMNTLTDAKLNNRIRSFKLKRGYMVTFSIRPGGYGYSRCFIAADKDLEMASLPDIMDQKISSYRIFKWLDASKKGIADAANDKAICTALNVTTTYEWWSGKADGLEPDVECVPHHYKESWPTPSACGKGNYSPHLKTNNEPRNTSDEEPCDLNDILANWEALMATGKRLCSPSSWDGSDYWNAKGFLKDFFEEIDKRGWRCDIIDLHSYWVLSNFQTNIPNWFEAVKRPVWVSEWVWGASWGNDGKGTGAFVSGVTEAQNASNVKTICEYMNGLDYVERYYFWNSERAPSRLYTGQLTAAGEYYASLNPGLAYKGATNYIPSEPQIGGPTLTTITAGGKISLRWYEAYGELTKSMALEYSSDGKSWQTIASFELNENPQYYTHDASMGEGQYRVHTVDYKGTAHNSAAVSVSGSSYYLYNVGAQQWLCTGNAWGSHASLTKNGGIDVLAKEIAVGKYNIDTQLVNGDNHYLNMLDNGPWMDQTPGEWTFTAVGDGVFLLTCNGKNLAYDGSTSSLIGSDATDANAQWIFQTRDDRMALLEAATVDNPVDASFLIVDNDFARYNSMRRNYWQGAPVVNGHFDGSTGNQCAEKYNTTFDVYQNISGAPAGKYRLMVQGFYRNGKFTDAAKKYNSGTEQLDAILYANSVEKPLQSIFTEAGKLDVGIMIDEIDGKFPDSMDDAAQFFLNDKLYLNTIEFTLEEGEELRLGIKKSVATADDWTIFDNFRLYYTGPVQTGPEQQDPDLSGFMAELKATVQKATNKADALTSDDVPQSYIDELQSYASIYSDDQIEAMTSEEEITQAIDDVNATLRKENPFRIVYAEWKAAKANYDELAGVPSDNQTANDEFVGIVNAQDLAVQDATAPDDIRTAIETADMAVMAYLTEASPAEGSEFDLTFLLTNPDVTSFWNGEWGVTPDGWYTQQTDGNFQVMTNEKMGASGEVFMEYWSETPATKDYVLCQHVTLPGGIYKVTTLAGLQENVGGTTARVTLSVNETDYMPIALGMLADTQMIFELEEQEAQELMIGLKAHEGNCYRWMAINKMTLTKQPANTVPTAIDGALHLNDKCGVVYDLQGRKVNAQLPKGLYISGGRKLLK